MPLLGTYSAGSIRGWRALGGAGGGAGWSLASFIPDVVVTVSYANGLFLAGNNTNYYLSSLATTWDAHRTPVTYNNQPIVNTAFTAQVRNNSLSFGLGYILYASQQAPQRVRYNYVNNNFVADVTTVYDPRDVNGGTYDTIFGESTLERVGSIIVNDVEYLSAFSRPARNEEAYSSLVADGTVVRRWIAPVSQDLGGRPSIPEYVVYFPVTAKTYVMAGPEFNGTIYTNTASVSTVEPSFVTVLSGLKNVYAAAANNSVMIVSAQEAAGNYTIQYTADGLTWNSVPSPNNLFFTQIIFHLNLFWGILSDGEIYSSFDGITWTYTDNNSGFITGEELLAYYIAPAGTNVVALSSSSGHSSDGTYVQLF